MRTVVFFLLVVGSLLWATACKEEARSTNDGLQPGINYMQPFRWRMIYNYRVQEITPDRAFIRPRPSAYDPAIDAVGDGTYQVWFVGPREGEEIRDVKLVSQSPKPTAVKKGTDTDVTFYYYDFAPDGALPREISASMTFEFITFERYTYWEGMKIEDYDKNSDIYKQYTKEEPPIRFHNQMRKVVDKIKEESKGDVVQTALGCYNYVVSNFTYDSTLIEWMEAAGGSALTDSYRTWENKAGICDEFATVLCAMLRYAGIPARPCSGIVHPPMNIDALEKDKERNAIVRVCDKMGPILEGYGHAWTEFYLPGVGWVPADATWGQADWLVDKYTSYIGAKRQIPVVDYYFGKSDPYRITWFKDWNYTLNPLPKDSGSPTVDQMVGFCERTTGIRAMKTGWTGIAGRKGYDLGWYRSKETAGFNFDIEIQALGPVADGEIPDVIKAMNDEGAHYLRVPAIHGDWPRWTAGWDSAEERAKDRIDYVLAVDKEMKRDRASTLIDDLIRKAVER